VAGLICEWPDLKLKTGHLSIEGQQKGRCILTNLTAPEIRPGGGVAAPGIKVGTGTRDKRYLCLTHKCKRGRLQLAALVISDLQFVASSAQKQRNEPRNPHSSLRKGARNRKRDGHLQVKGRLKHSEARPHPAVSNKAFCVATPARSRFVGHARAMSDSSFGVQQPPYSLHKLLGFTKERMVRRRPLG